MKEREISDEELDREAEEHLAWKAIAERVRFEWPMYGFAMPEE